MTSIVYVPKNPISIPLFNNETNCYSVYFDDGEVEIPGELFFKIFKQQEVVEEAKTDNEKPTISDFIKQNYTKQEIEKEIDKSKDQLTMRIRQAKMFGMTKEFFMNQLKSDPHAKEIFKDKPSFDYVVSLTEDIWNEIEKPR